MVALAIHRSSKSPRRTSAASRRSGDSRNARRRPPANHTTRRRRHHVRGVAASRKSLHSTRPLAGSSGPGTLAFRDDGGVTRADLVDRRYREPLVYGVREFHLRDQSRRMERPSPTFGDKGPLDLRANLRGAPESNSYHATTPGVVYKDLLILGGRVSERTPASLGDERAYDVRTGELRWTFRTIPAAGEPGAETWPAGARDTQGRSERLGRGRSSTRSAASSSSPPGPPPTIFTASTGQAIISTPIASSRSTRTRARSSGTSRRPATTCGTPISRRRRFFFDRQSQRQAHRCGLGHQQVRLRLYLRPRHRRIAVSDDRDEGAEEHKYQARSRRRRSRCPPCPRRCRS